MGDAQLGTYTILHLDGPCEGEIHDVPAALMHHGSYNYAYPPTVSASNLYLDGSTRPVGVGFSQVKYDLHRMACYLDDDTRLIVRVACTFFCSEGAKGGSSLAAAVSLIHAWRGVLGLDEGRAWWIEKRPDA